MIAALGSLLLALCGLPQAIKAYRRPDSTRGLSWAFLAAWGSGEICLLCALYDAPGVPWVVLANYAANVWLIGYIVVVKAMQSPRRYS